MYSQDRINALECDLLTQAGSKPEAAEIVAAMAPGSWQNPAHARIAQLIKELHSRGDVVSIASVGAVLGDAAIRDWFGDWARFTDCLSSKNTSLPASTLRKMIEEAAAKRKMQYGLKDAQRMMQEGHSLADVQEHVQATVDSTSRVTPKQHHDGPVLVCLKDIEPKSVDWLWDGRIPLGRITLLVGYPGEGKSFLTTDMASRVSTGTPWPDKRVCPQGSVIFICAEDNPGDTIRPRLDAHSANCDKIHLLTMVKRSGKGKQHETLFSLADVDALEKTLQQLPDCKLIIIDPIGSFLGGKVDAHRDNEVRSVLAPVAQLAEKYCVAVLVVCHRNKGKSNRADDLVMGSRAFTGIARSVLHLSRDALDKKRRLLLPGKINIASECDGAAFTIIGQPPAIAWEHNPVMMNADDALAVENNGIHEAKPGPKPLARNAAGEWLATLLAKGSMTVPEIKQAAQDAGLAWRTTQRAAEELGVVRTKDQFSGNWRWSPGDAK